MKKISISFLFLCLLLFCCTNDVIPIIEDCDSALSYDNGMSELIDRTCAYTDCHVAGFSYGNFTSYADLKRYADSFLPHIYGDKDLMPPENNTPLTEAEIDQFNCWVNNGYPEN